ncbi:helix-turn-helix domain-containing protein [Dankookia sp. GCM10030260]|uniref:helix-turn-helix domain-containing protein n=1 Tax=Dankookia sp. GCM10030260 TaxID=3273390 RepID=UPI0036106799
MGPLLPRVSNPAPCPGDLLRHTTAPGNGANDKEDLPQPLPRLLSAAEVAVVFNRSERAIRAWTQRGYLRPVRVGRSLFFREDDVRALVADQLCRGILAHAPDQADRVAPPPGTLGPRRRKPLK